MVAIVHPIHPRIPRRTTTPKNAVISSIAIAKKYRSTPYTIIPKTLPRRMIPPRDLSFAIQMEGSRKPNLTVLMRKKHAPGVCCGSASVLRPSPSYSWLFGLQCEVKTLQEDGIIANVT